MNLDADRKLLDGLTKLKDHLYGRVCELLDELRTELGASMTVSPKMKLFYALVRRCKRVSAQVKRLAPKVRMAQLRFDMLSDPKWRRRVIDDLGGEKALQSWERRMERLAAPKGVLWEEQRLYSAYVPGVGELAPPSVPSGHLPLKGEAKPHITESVHSRLAPPSGGAGRTQVRSEGVARTRSHSYRPKPPHKRLSNTNRKSKPFDYSHVMSNPLTVVDPCRLDQEGYFRLAPIPRGEMQNKPTREIEDRPDWYKQQIIGLRKARLEQAKRFGREGLRPIALTPTELREGIIIPFRQARLNRAAQPGAAVYKYNNDNWESGPREAVVPKARSPSKPRGSANASRSLPRSVGLDVC